jgi:cytochrome c oxidase cbb3-type subunit 3
VRQGQEKEVGAFGAWLVLGICAASGTTSCGRAPQPEPAARTPQPSQAQLEPQAQLPPQAQPQGEELYARICAVCHGRTGEGYKADQAPALAQPEFLASVSDDFLRRAIMNGRRGTTMSAWSRERGGPLSGAEGEAVIAWLRTWQKLPRATLDERPLAGDVARGSVLYTRECMRCHGARGTAGPNVHIGDRELLAGASNGFLRYAIRKGRPGTAMPGFDPTLGDHGIEDVVAFLRSLPTSTAPEPPPAAAPPPPLPLGPIPLNPKGPEPRGFKAFPGATSVDVVHSQLLRHARMALLDARAPPDYMTGHIAGAVSVPYYDPSPYLSALPKDTWFVCYCACPHAESGELAEKLVARGFKKVTVLDEGIGVWIVKKYETHTGVNP